METKLETKITYQPFNQVEADALAVVLFEDEAAPPELSGFATWLEELKSSDEFSAKSGDLVVLHQPRGLTAKRLAVIGGGKKEKFDAGALRKAVGSAVRVLKQKGVKKLAWWL